jgi:hypothetical protein
MQRQAMEEAARAIFKSELDATLRRLVVPLQQVTARLDRAWHHRTLHAATACAASIATWALVLWLR